MSATADWEQHLHAELPKKERRDTYDMSDATEIACADCHPRLQSALRILQGMIGSEWATADDAAVRHQKLHQYLAVTAITAGTLAVVCAIAQLAEVKVAWLEYLAVVAAGTAVFFGLRARTNHHWLGHRHRAERLRMLKFRAIARLLSDDEQQFQTELSAERQTVPDASDSARLEQWEREGSVEPPSPPPPRGDLDPDFAQAVISYYLVKRVAYQGAYFERRYREYESKSRTWRRLSFPLFLGSVLSVILHFVFEQVGHNEQVSDAFLAMAAILPVLGAGARAWLGAFELPRSASLFRAKHHALQSIAESLRRDREDIAATQRHIAEIEHFLANEHREWLRLLRDTEWYL